jgi:hypothetical protein
MFALAFGSGVESVYPATLTFRKVTFYLAGFVGVLLHATRERF